MTILLNHQYPKLSCRCGSHTGKCSLGLAYLTLLQHRKFFTLMVLKTLKSFFAISNKTTCHFFLEIIDQTTLPSLNTECCNQPVHCGCFETWIHSSFIRTRNIQSSCAYCRSEYDDNRCFLCFKKVKQDEEYLKSLCCKTKLHTKCVMELHHLYNSKEIRPDLAFPKTLVTACISWVLCFKISKWGKYIKNPLSAPDVLICSYTFLYVHIQF